MMGSHNYPGHHQPNNPMVGYNNGAAMHISPTPSARNQLGMQASPALAATAPQHFNGPAVCHQAQVGQPQGQQQQAPAMYGTCPAQQQSPVVASGVVAAQQGQQQPNMVGCNVMQPSNYSQAGANYGPAHAAGVNAMPYNNYNNQQPAMAMNNGYMMNQQCGHMQAAQQQANPVAQGFNNPCSPCTGHHHQQPQPVCNNNPGNNQNWQCGYPTPNAMTQQQQQHHQAMPFPQQQQHNNVAWQNNAMQGPGNGASNVQVPPTNAQSLMYNNMQSNAAMAYNNYPRPPPYSQVASAIQCQDVSQSQDFINRARVQGAAQQQGPSATPVQQQHSQQINNAATAVPSVATGVTTPSNMRPETYQRTLEYVQQCQSWSSTGDGNNGGRAAKENKPPQQQQQQQPGACEPQMTKTAETAAVGRALLSPGQDAVSSSTDRQEAAAAAAAALLPSSANNMVVNDMNTSLNSLMQENRFLQMIQ
jgi:transcriptional activator cubitus interruptus